MLVLVKELVINRKQQMVVSTTAFMVKDVSVLMDFCLKEVTVCLKMNVDVLSKEEGLYRMVTLTLTPIAPPVVRVTTMYSHVRTTGAVQTQTVKKEIMLECVIAMMVLKEMDRGVHQLSEKTVLIYITLVIGTMQCTPFTPRVGPVEAFRFTVI